MNVDKLLEEAAKGVEGDAVLDYTRLRCRDLSYRLWDLSVRCYKFRMDERISKAAMSSDSTDEQYVHQSLMAAERGVADALERLTKLHGDAVQRSRS